jgi:hypothetical protein
MRKRISGAVVTAAAFVIVSAGSALAQTSTSYPPTPSATTSVEGTSGGSDAPTAFTGGRIGFAVVAIVVLVALGIAASVVARRRSARAAG